MSKELTKIYVYDYTGYIYEYDSVNIPLMDELIMLRKLSPVKSGGIHKVTSVVHLTNGDVGISVEKLQKWEMSNSVKGLQELIDAEMGE